MADAIVYATAKAVECPVVTSDNHFLDLDNVFLFKFGYNYLDIRFFDGL